MEREFLPKEVVEEIMKIFKRGNSVELKKEHDKIVVVEIQRKLKFKIL